jgi:hypothetical protein
VSFTTRPLYALENSSLYPLDRSLVGLRIRLDGVDRRESYPFRDSNFHPSAVQPVASRYTDCVITVPGLNTLTFKQAIYFFL